jgi:hypothetical protein
MRDRSVSFLCRRFECESCDQPPRHEHRRPNINLSHRFLIPMPEPAKELELDWVACDYMGRVSDPTNSFPVQVQWSVL